MTDTIDRFLAAAAANPGHAAISQNDELTSYAALEERARRIAAHVARHDQPNVLIALPQSADAYAAMLGVGLGGGCYAPVNVAAPPEKLSLIAHLLEPELIFSLEGLEGVLRAAAPQAEVLAVEEMYALPPLAGAGRRHELAYIIFTSGTTGMPKGVMIPRIALDHYVASIEDLLHITAEDRVSQHPNIAFDVSVMEIYGALCYGATLCPVASKGERLMPARTIARERISVWVSVPSVISLMRRAGEVTTGNLATVRLFAFCGEPLLRQHLDAIFAARADAIVMNTYGPTEATVSMTSLRLTKDDYLNACAESVALGQPIEDMDLRLIGGPGPDEGELVICGPQLASGYWRSPELTAKSFKTIDLGGQPQRAYFTGDWANRVGGHVFFKGRIDFQVKVNGYRLELGEVAAAIRACGWSDVCVVMWRSQLSAVIEAPGAGALDVQELRRQLADKLEPHAIPAVLRTIPTLPRNANDKIDSVAVNAWLEASAQAAAKE